MRKRHRRQLREVASGRRRRNLSRDKYKQYSNEDMRAALEEVSEGGQKGQQKKDEDSRVDEEEDEDEEEFELDINDDSKTKA